MTHVTTPSEDGKGHYWPQLLPDGRSVLFTVATGPDDAQAAVASLETGEWHIVGDALQSQYVSTGHLVYKSDGALWVSAFDPGAGRMFGDAI